MIIEVKNMKSYYIHFPKIKSRFYFLYYYKTIHIIKLLIIKLLNISNFKLYHFTYIYIICLKITHAKFHKIKITIQNKLIIKINLTFKIHLLSIH